MCRFDYDSVDWQFVSKILNENSLRLSRTYSGYSDTSTSEEKLPLLLSGPALKERAAESERTVHKLIFDARHSERPKDAAAVTCLLYQIVDTTNNGLLPAGRFRTWEIRANQNSIDSDKAV